MQKKNQIIIEFFLHLSYDYMVAVTLCWCLRCFCIVKSPSVDCGCVSEFDSAAALLVEDCTNRLDSAAATSTSVSYYITVRLPVPIFCSRSSKRCSRCVHTCICYVVSTVRLLMRTHLLGHPNGAAAELTIA